MNALYNTISYRSYFLYIIFITIILYSPAVYSQVGHRCVYGCEGAAGSSNSSNSSDPSMPSVPSASDKAISAEYYKYADDLNEKGITYWKERNWKKAAKYFKEASEFDPDNEVIRSNYNAAKQRADAEARANHQNKIDARKNAKANKVAERKQKELDKQALEEAKKKTAVKTKQDNEDAQNKSKDTSAKVKTSDPLNGSSYMTADERQRLRLIKQFGPNYIDQAASFVKMPYPQNRIDGNISAQSSYGAAEIKTVIQELEGPWGKIGSWELNIMDESLKGIQNAVDAWISGNDAKTEESANNLLNQQVVLDATGKSIGEGVIDAASDKAVTLGGNRITEFHSKNEIARLVENGADIKPENVKELKKIKNVTETGKTYYNTLYMTSKTYLDYYQNTKD
jgi:hypothetical protein